MAESSCVYLVTSVSSGCTQYTENDIVTGPCSAPCVDRIITDGPCAGTTLMAVSDECMVYPPEDLAAFDGGIAQKRRGNADGKPIKSSEITGHFPRS